MKCKKLTLEVLVLGATRKKPWTCLLTVNSHPLRLLGTVRQGKWSWLKDPKFCTTSLPWSHSHKEYPWFLGKLIHHVNTWKREMDYAKRKYHVPHLGTPRLILSSHRRPCWTQWENSTPGINWETTNTSERSVGKSETAWTTMSTQ